jgi:hypothetical protein
MLVNIIIPLLLFLITLLFGNNECYKLQNAQKYKYSFYKILPETMYLVTQGLSF